MRVFPASSQKGTSSLGVPSVCRAEQCLVPTWVQSGRGYAVPNKQQASRVAADRARKEQG